MLTKRAIHDLIEFDQKRNVERLNNLFTSCKNRSLQSEFTHLASTLEGQVSPSTKEAFLHDQKISQVISDLENDIAQESYMVAASRIRTLKTLLVQREKYCNAGTGVLMGSKADQKKAKKLDKIRTKILKGEGFTHAAAYSVDRIVDFMINQAAEKQQMAAAELQDLHDRIVKNPQDSVAKASWRAKVINYNKCNKALAVLSLQAQRVALVQAAGDLLSGSEQEEIAKAMSSDSAQIDDAKFTLIMDKLNRWVERQIESGRVTEEAARDFLDVDIISEVDKATQGTSGASQGARSAQQGGFASAQQGGFASAQQGGFASAQQGGYAPVQRGGAASGQQFPGADGAIPSDMSEFENDPIFAQFGGFPDTNEQAFQQIYEHAPEIISRLEAEQRRNEAEIDKLDADRQDVADELLDLLRQRETATPAECIVLDGKIDRLEKKHAGLKRDIKRQNRLMSKLSETLDMVRNIQSSRRPVTRDECLEIYGGGERFAQYILDEERKQNAELDHMGEANMMANSEPINQYTMRSESTTDRYGADKKDPEKYASLMQELSGEVAGGGRR